MLNQFFKAAYLEGFEIVVKLGALRFTKTFTRDDWSRLRNQNAPTILIGMGTTSALEEIKFELGNAS